MPRKILIVDDIASNRLILKQMLQKDYEILEAASGEEALLILSQNSSAISAVLLDIGMPGIDGFEVLHRIRSNAQLANLTVIMITGSEDKETRVKSLSMGANDFVMKPYSSEIIMHCLGNNIAFREASATVSAMQRDRLTGLYSRETFFEKVREMVAVHEAGYYIMACFDIDRFKVINDQYGTQKGDEVLLHIARVFQEGFEPHGGICCRVSGDNYAVLYPAWFQDTPEIKEIRSRAAHVEGLISPVSFCIGRYLIDDFFMLPSAMYDRALLAASSVKGRYDTKIGFYDEAMRKHLIREQEIVLEMEDALKERQFEVWFQPQYNHSTGAMIGAEALVRWRHPKKGLIPPDDFIPIFEQNGFVYSLDKFVWEEVCRHLYRWREEGHPLLPVSVNVSRYDLFCPDVVETITGLIKKYGLSMDLLRLEITESAFSESPQHIVDMVKELLQCGFTVEIDDFGSGYSSLNTLKDVPAQIIKLDMKFLKSSDDSRRGGNIVESIVRMAKWLDMSVIAEGVETLAQANYLRSIGCNYMQGYLYAKPMPPDQYEAHCGGTPIEGYLLTLETVENLDNNAFWDPSSMDTLIFNSYVGGACIYEYHNGNIELLRATEKYAQIIGSAGMTVEDALKLNWTEHLDEENSRQVVADLEESIATKKEVTGEYVFLDLPGCPHKTYLRSTMRVIASVGERYLVYCTNENITAQRRAENKERRMSEQMQTIMDNVDLGIIAAVLENGVARYLFANNRYYEMLGYTEAQFEAEIHSPYQTIAPEDRQRIVEETSELNITEKPAVLVYNVLTRDGRKRVFRAAISLGRLTGIEGPVQFTILRDITEETETEQRERLAADQIKNMMNDMPGGFVRMKVDEDGSIRPVYFNEGFFRLTAMNDDQLMDIYGDNALAGVHPDDVDPLKAVVEKMLQNGQAQSFRYRLLHGTGGYFWVSIFGRTTKDLSGDTYLNIYYSDASEQVKEEETQKTLLDNLPGGAGVYEFKDGQMNLTYQNKSYWELVGLNKADFPDPAPMSAVHPDDISVIMRELSSAIEQKRDVVCDIRLRHLTKGYRSVHLVGRIVYKETGGFLIYATFTPNDQKSMSYQQTLPLLLSAIMESTTDLSFAKDTSFRYLTCSLAFANMAGQRDVGDVVGKTDYDLFDKELADKFRRDDEALLANGRAIVDTVEAIPSTDGSPRYSSTSKYVLRDGFGAVIGLYGVGRDVTRAVVQDSQLKLLNDNIPGGLATYAWKDNSLHIAYCNDEFCKLFGGTRRGLEEQGDFAPLDWVFQEDRAELLSQVASLVREDTPIDCVFRIHVLGGGYKWINEKAVLAQRRGETVLFNAVLLDVTERQNALERLRISEEESSLATHLGGNVICRYFIAERRLVIQPDVAELYSLPEALENVPQEPVRLGMIAAESADAYTAFFEAILGGEKTASAIFQQKYLGSWKWMEAKSSTIFSDDGQPVKAVISFLDITEKVEREAIYTKWRQSLQGRQPESYMLFRCNISNKSSFDTTEGSLLTVNFEDGVFDFDDRTAEYVAKCVFEEDRDRFFAFLNVDSLLADFYQGNRVLSIDYREKLPDNAIRWLRLTVDLVDSPYTSDVDAYLLFENIDAAKRLELQMKELSETDPLTGVLNRTTFAAEVDRILHSSSVETRHALLMLDIDGFKQVNDVFGHSAGDQALIDIADSLRSILRHNDLIARLGGDEFVIFLNGILDDSAAMAKAKQVCALVRRAFSLEVQISGSVGIAVAPHDGMDFHALYKNADSALYNVKGSGKDSFAFYNNEMADEHLEPEPDVIALNGTKKIDKKRRMLIVDDNSIDHAMLQNLFCEEFIIEKARDGNTALIRLRHYGSAISVVLLDLVMPGMDGFAVLEKMQESAELRGIPVIIVSGDESRESCLQAVRMGAADFITKPVDIDLLRLRVHSSVSKAENERLRAKNSLLEVLNEERVRYESALESVGLTFIEFNWCTGAFSYYPSISKYLWGTYDGRALWQILLSDMAADTKTVQDMQQLVHRVAEDRTLTVAARKVRLKTPQGVLHTFRMSVRKLENEYQFTNRLVIALDDLDYEAH